MLRSSRGGTIPVYLLPGPKVVPGREVIALSADDHDPNRALFPRAFESQVDLVEQTPALGIAAGASSRHRYESDRAIGLMADVLQVHVDLLEAREKATLAPRDKMTLESFCETVAI
ncbi:MAG: hypothetical protein NTZ61_04130 [Proteobacteria bacterium]|nr:hypothetical protein [Pseudomonadota bacterium]